MKKENWKGLEKVLSDTLNTLAKKEEKELKALHKTRNKLADELQKEVKEKE